MRFTAVGLPAGILVHVTAFVTAGGGFLLAILYADLLHDVQVLGHRGRELPDTVLGSISGFYRRVTISARPLNRLVVVVMIEVLGSIGVQIARGDHPRWVAWASLPLAGAPIALAGLRTFPAAVQLGGRTTQDFPLLPRLTVTGIRGGGAFSVVPSVCTVDVDVRLTPTFAASDAEAVASGAQRPDTRR